MTAPASGPNRLTDLWLPIGPSTVLGGQPADQPDITGRVLEVVVSPDGTRVYAATANGGVWYSGDQGSSWLALSAWFSTPQADQLDRYANALTCGGIAVSWDSTPGGENDTVYVGTGETTPGRQGYPGGQLGGIGVLRAVGPVMLTRTDPFAPVWSVEGQTVLQGLGTYRLAMRPGHPDELVLATSDGLFFRSGTTGPDNWTKVTADPFTGPAVVTDAIWGADHIWVSVHSRGVWRADQASGPFTKIDLPDLVNGRLALGAAADGSVIYALGDGPRLWRITGTSAVRVASVPAGLFGGTSAATGGHDSDEDAARQTPLPEHELPPEATGNQEFYDVIVAVHPDLPNVIALGGSAMQVSDGSLFRCTVQDPTGTPHLDYSPAHDAAGDDPERDPTFIGRGLHADLHGATFAKRGGNVDLWICGDGGVYRSTRGGRSSAWQARNNGLAIAEAGYVACHPDSEAVVVVGTQDNGVLERTGDTTWKWALDGDGGGVTFHPAHGQRYMAQATGAVWRDQGNANISPVNRHYLRLDYENREGGNANFYSSPGAIATGDNPDSARLALGTNRVWVSNDFGGHWFTVPHANDPLGTDPSGQQRHDTGQDVPYDDERATVLACRWADDRQLYVLCAQSVQRYTRAQATETWKREAVSDQHNKCSDYSESDIKGSKMPHLPPLGQWSDLAIHTRDRGGGASTLYVACTSVKGSTKMDTLWWFDGTGNWFATKLRDAVKAPALAVVVHPVNPDIVYVGTTVGVWRGTFSRAAGADPVWVWSTFSSGLPEAAVQDLAFYRDPASGPPGMLLLRAALQSRGTWEVDLLAPCDERTYLRVHGLDTRRRAVTPLTNPMGATPFGLFASPDVAVRPAPPDTAANMPGIPPDAFFPISASRHPQSFELWTFQTAFRAVEPTCRPTGRWSDTFAAALVNYKSANALGTAPVIDKPTWTNVVKQANVYQPPWDGPSPTEADLLQLIRDEVGGGAETTFSSRRLKVDVLVHQRGLQQLQPASVSVLLLMRRLTDTPASWTSLTIDDPWRAATVTALTSGSPPAGGWPNQWAPADGAAAVRHPAGNIDAARPQAATFDLTFPAAAPVGRYMLVAVCSSATATVSAAGLQGATLGDLLQRSSFVAARALLLI